MLSPHSVHRRQPRCPLRAAEPCEAAGRSRNSGAEQNSVWAALCLCSRIQLSVIVNNKYIAVTHFVYVCYFLYPSGASCYHGTQRPPTCVLIWPQSAWAEHILFSNYLPTARCSPHHDQFTKHWARAIYFQCIQLIIYCIANSGFCLVLCAVGCAHLLTASV